jgi:protein-serine/threonine kinase
MPEATTAAPSKPPSPSERRLHSAGQLTIRKTRLSSWPRRYDHADDPDTMPSSKSPNGPNSHFPQKLKNFFRINSFSSNSSGDHGPLKSDSKSSFRQSKFFTTVGRLRSATVASEGNTLDEALSPTAHANPYFAHQGQPGLRHHNVGSVPPSPPDTPQVKIEGANGATERATTATKEELARKLRRVASAPNAQGLFSKGKGSGERPATAELGKDPIMINKNSSTVGLVEAKGVADSPGSLGVPDKDGLGALPSPRGSPLAFRRTYSSNSIKVRNVEVGPQSFDKIKLIGKGDVGKVYLVSEKKSSRLYAMKGLFAPSPCSRLILTEADKNPCQ